MMMAKEIMTSDIITVAPEMAVEDLAAILFEHKISGVPVITGDGALFGVVTESDLIDQAKNVHIPTVVSILDSFLFLENPNKMDEEIKKMTGRTVADICNNNAVVVAPDTTLSDVATIMAEKKVHTLPVMEGDKLVGVIGKTDIIRTIMDKKE